MLVGRKALGKRWLTDPPKSGINTEKEGGKKGGKKRVVKA